MSSARRDGKRAPGPTLHPSARRSVIGGIVAAALVLGGHPATAATDRELRESLHVASLQESRSEDTVSDEQSFYAKTNDLRRSKGVAALVIDVQLRAIARRWSAHMAASGTLSHNPNLAQEVTENWSTLGENVGVGPSVDAIQQAFVNSPHHYANLVDPGFVYVGIGVSYGSNGAVWVTEDFMQPASTAPPATAPPAAPRTSPPVRALQPVNTTPAPVTSTTSTTAGCAASTEPPLTVSSTATPSSCALPKIVDRFRELDANS